MDLDATQGFEITAHYGRFTLASLAECVLAPRLDIEPEIGRVYVLECAIWLFRLVLVQMCAIWLFELAPLTHADVLLDWHVKSNPACGITAF